MTCSHLLNKIKLVRHSLNHIDEGEQLLRKKEIYEVLYPETKKGAVNQYTKTLSEESSVSRPKSFVDDSAEKMQLSPPLPQVAKPIFCDHPYPQVGTMPFLTSWENFK